MAGWVSCVVGWVNNMCLDGYKFEEQKQQQTYFTYAINYALTFGVTSAYAWIMVYFCTCAYVSNGIVQRHVSTGKCLDGQQFDAA